jgi:AcrR family transcriptional regulator
MRTKPAGSVKRLRGQQTYERIREAAHRLFVKNGFDHTRVDAIAAAAGISKGTFYLHFDRKEDLLLEYGARRLLRIREMLPGLLTSRKSFREAMNEILDVTVRGKPWSREVTGLAMLAMGSRYERLPIQSPHEIFQPLVELGQARGEIRGDVPADLIAQFVVRTILGALRDWGLGTNDLSREAALDHALTLVLDAVTKRDAQGP